MPKPKRPRFGSMGVWPRKRAKNQTPRVRSYANIQTAKPLEFAGYKAGMTRVLLQTQEKGKRGGSEHMVSATIIECPPMKIASLRLYKKDKVVKQINFKAEKELAKTTNVTKDKFSSPKDLETLNADEYTDATIQVYTQPKLIGFKKKPEIFEISLGGKVKDKIEFVKAHAEKPILINEVFQVGQNVDAHSITKGKGYQGPVKRFGIGLKNHKSEKGVRSVGSLGGWSGQGHVMYRVAHAGQTGYHQRTQYNNLIIKMSDKPEEINAKGGFIRYGFVKNPYILIKGSIAGPKKRLIKLTEPVRQHKKPAFKPEQVKMIMTDSNQGR